MTWRCKPGDLAMVTHDEDSCSSNFGKLVKVTGPISFNVPLQKQCWIIEPVKPELWACVSYHGKAFQKVVTFACRMEHPDDWLVPLRPGAEDDPEQFSTITPTVQAEETLL